MNVTELFRRLSYGELSNLAIGAEGAGTIPEDHRAKMIAYTNEALLRLYSRFVLREQDLILELSDFITNYLFLKRFAQSNTEPCPGDTLYIVDHAGDPFQEDLIRVLRVTNAVGQPLVLNDQGNCHSLFTPQPNILQVPNPVQGQILGVVYQARHPVLAYDDMDACVEVPIVLEEALTSYIAHKVYFNMNGQENVAKAKDLLGIYEGICADVIDKDLVNSSSSTTQYKFHERGFV